MKYKAYVPVKLGAVIYQAGECFELNDRQKKKLKDQGVTLEVVDERNKKTQ